ncbi:fibronectin type III domain-containing protein, partial [Legionella bozemanae]|uniref:fibronectin type III domain-containing protein n=1 Tax=Legionella bozemanae TaxID=447 RepID=UPI001040FEEB
GDTYDVAATASSGLTVAITVDSSSSSVCSISGSTVTFNAAGTCTVNANQAGNAQYNAAPQLQQTITVVATFPVAKGPSNVFAVPGNGQATISWTAPSNTGTGTITGYTVTYGLTSGTTFTTVGCTAMAPSSTCTVTGLTNGTAYTFAVSTVTQKDGL